MLSNASAPVGKQKTRILRLFT